uniref:EGF-like domain-containing protein n=1 Tax=Heterorhabditis bacteriophora TaxID=37862 RepID=A0A1I7WNZ0_HETBA
MLTHKQLFWMTIVEQLSIGRVWQEEGERNGDVFRFLNGTDLSLQIPLRMTYTTRPSQDFEEPQFDAESESVIGIQSRSFGSELQLILHSMHFLTKIQACCNGNCHSYEKIDDLFGVSCCKDEPFNTYTHICCDGVVRDRNRGGSYAELCCGTEVLGYDQTCCGGVKKLV